MDPNNEYNSEDRPFNPVLFFSVLFAPSVLVIIFFLAFGDAAVLILALGSPIAGIFCGGHLNQSRDTKATIDGFVIEILTVIGCIIAAAALAFGGCFVIGTASGLL